ncbi:histone methylation protein DOT1-like protein [Pseudoduganella eburnea]|uniref:Histone methylation protein DOT1-like protein n=2 Tax=Massilia eburnea TaxID=1776165 RepID=A0A6L6QNB9_9BURK|nr:histone methylation protein DOT1-like protein [Massilia eburnea]
MRAMRQAISSGTQHLRPVQDDALSARYVEIGLAVREAFRTPALRETFIARLKPHRRLIAGSVPAGIQQHGLLPARAATCRLSDVSDADLAQWLVDDGRLIYGEFTQQELDNYFNEMAPYLPPKGHFIDLGSGLGKVVMSAALAFPGLRCTGVELLTYRHEMAQVRLAEMLAAGVAENRGVAANVARRIRLVQQDMFDADVSDASLVYVYSTCFAPLMDRLADKLARELQPGALVTTVTFPMQHPAFELVKQFSPPSVAWTTVYLYRRRSALDPLPAEPPKFLYEQDSAAWEYAVRAAFAAYDATSGA